MTRFVVIPQWQASTSPRAMLLSDGARTIAEDLPQRSTQLLDIPLTSGEDLGTGIRRFSTLARIGDQGVTVVREIVNAAGSEHTVIIGGDRATMLPLLRARADALDSAALIWCDAKPGLHTPQPGQSRALDEMVLATVLGLCPAPDQTAELGLHALGPQPPMASTRVVLVGARDLDEYSADVINQRGIVHVAADTLGDPEALSTTVAGLEPAGFFVHVDLSVMDPAEISGITEPVPFGVRTADLVQAIRELRQRKPLWGASISGFAPRSPADAVADLGVILRLIGALA